MTNRYELVERLDRLRSLLAKTERAPELMEHPGATNELYSIAIDAVTAAEQQIRTRLDELCP